MDSIIPTLPGSKEIRKAFIILGGLALAALGSYALAKMMGRLELKWVLLFMFILAAGPVLAILAKEKLRLLLLMLALLALPVPVNRILYRDQAYELKIGAYHMPGLSLSDMCILVLFLVWLLEILLKRRPFKAPTALELLLPLGFIVWTGLSVLYAPETKVSLFETFRLVKIFIVYICVLSTIEEHKALRYAVICLLATVALESLLAIAQYLTGSGLGLQVLGEGETFAIPELGTPEMLTRRASGTLTHPNRLAAYLTLVAPLAMSLSLTELKTVHKALCLVVVFLALIAMLVTGSRGGFTALTAAGGGVILLQIWRPRRPQHFFLWCLVTVSSLGFASFLLWSVLAARPVMPTFYDRLRLMSRAWEVVQAHPLAGIGAGNYFVLVDRMLVHNVYLLIAAEMGLVGLVLFLGCFLIVIRKAWAGIASYDELLSGVAVGGVAALLGYAVNMMVDINHQMSAIMSLFWVIAGLAVATGRLARQEKR